jgi:exodeoxyribonuclease VII large subunit
VSRRGSVLPIETAAGEPRIWTVGEIADAIRGALEAEFGTVIVQGEITGYTAHHSGHHYFGLKDDRGRIDVALFKGRAQSLRGPLQNGMAVQVEGQLTAYAPKSSYQLIALRVTPVGYGALQAQFEALKRKLAAEGCFDEERKRPLPRYPTRIGLVTSPTGAAIRDMLRILRARAPYARLALAPARVQGEGAAGEVADAIRLLNEWGGVDVILVGRGGGSPEDLWAFNEEAVVRAIVGSRIPVVSAVGHEVDVTLSDFAADLRAATPTHAAQAVVRDRDEIRGTLARLSEHARRKLVAELGGARARLRGITTHHALRGPARRVREGQQAVDLIEERLRRGLEGWVMQRRRRLELLGERLQGFTPRRSLDRSREQLEALERRGARAAAARIERLRDRLTAQSRHLALVDYRNVLGRGYALVWAEGRTRLVNRGAGLAAGQAVELQFTDARARARVEGVVPGAEEERG